MKKWLVIMITGLALGAGSAAAQTGDAEAGKQKAEPCAACHGADGNSANPEWPKIAGQNAKYLRDALTAYRDGSRQDPLMAGQVAGLSDEDIADLAAWFANQSTQIGSADPDLAEAGEKIYRGGNAETGVSACMACHGPAGNGNAPAGYPALSGQHATYTAKQLRRYRDGERGDSPNARIMQDIADRMSDEEIQAVSSYIEGLH